MSDYSTITVGQIHQEEVDGRWEKTTGDKYYLRVDLMPNERDDKNVWSGVSRYEFSHKFSDPLLLFIELTGNEQNVLLRLGNTAGDTKSFDMFSYFRSVKKELLEDGFYPTVKYKKSFFGDDFEKFDGFSPFGFTLIQPSLKWFNQRFVYSVYRWPRELGIWREILKLRIHNLKFHNVRVYKDVVVRDVLWERSFRPKALVKNKH